jgi:predicted membrane-bound spermidine synthase
MKSININQRLADKILSVFLLFLCGLILWEIRKFSEYGAYFPYIITIFLAVFSFVYFIKSWVFTLRKMWSSEKEQQELILDLPSFLASFVGVLAYIFILFPLLGFLVGSILFCISVTLVIQISRAEASFKLAVLSFITTSIFCYMMYYIFRHLFHIHLP